MYSQNNDGSNQLMSILTGSYGQANHDMPNATASDPITDPQGMTYCQGTGMANYQGNGMDWGFNVQTNQPTVQNHHTPAQMNSTGFAPGGFAQTGFPMNVETSHPSLPSTNPNTTSWTLPPIGLPNTSNAHDPCDDQDLLQLAKQIANQSTSNFGGNGTQNNDDDPLWDTLSHLPQPSTSGVCDFGIDFEDICKEELLPITSTVSSFAPTVSSFAPTASPFALTTSPFAQTAAPFAPTVSSFAPSSHMLPSHAAPSVPGSTAQMAQATHIDGIKSMFRMLDFPSTSAADFPQRNEQAQVCDRSLDMSQHQGVTHTVTSDSVSNEPKLETTEATEEPSKRQSKFHLDKSKLHEVSLEKQSSDLAGLGLTVYNQDELEQDIMAQVDDAMEADEQARKKTLMQKQLNAVKEDISSCLLDLQKSEKVLDMLKGGKNTMNKDVKRRMISIRNQIDQKLKQLDKLQAKKKALLKGQSGLDETMQLPSAKASNEAAMQAMIGLDVDDKIRRGEMTPFGTVMDFAKKKKEPEKKQPAKSFLAEDSAFDKYLMDQETRNKKPSTAVKPDPKEQKQKDKAEKQRKKEDKHKSVKDKKRKEKSTAEKSNKFDAKDKRRYRPSETDFSNYRPSKRASFSRLSHNFSGDGRLSDQECGDEDEMYDEHLHNDEDDDYVPDELPDSDDKEWTDDKEPKPKRAKRKAMTFDDDFSPVKKKSKSVPLHKLNSKDDGDVETYKERIRAYLKANAKKKYDKIHHGEVDSDDESDVELDDGFSVPGRVWNKLYPFQKTGVRWLWELHGQECGGIVGDEMGLGKTIQIVAFLAGLEHSNRRDHGSKYKGLGPSIIVVPTTVMHQWVKEFHKWAPKFRVAVLHNTGSYKSTEESLVHSIFKSRGILIAAYSSVVIYQEILLRYDWHYVILDEGHKIRNPDAQITVACKQFRTCHRLILSGSPIQNNLKELWSLFDFVFPGKLGTLPDFMAHFSVPIVQGGYSNANQVQVQTAFKCASVLRDTINPYLLRRMKSDVKENLQLPEKNEQVLFCRLTDHQKDTYQEYLDSRECQEILRGNFMVFPGLITLRKICNHPDLSTGGVNQFDQDYNTMSEEEKEFGYPGRSGKMMVVQSLLRLWHKQGHRVLLFSQGTQMLNILENQIKSEGYSYMRMDGGTSIGARQGMIDKYNNNPDIFVFLLTTRVGGLGVNLCGANRVLLFDPDWNPSTDTQARERAWRIGQSRQVTIYRLLTAGTIEEKIYHRQIFKQFLTNRVLKDPKQRRFFKSNDLFELFTLTSDDPNHGTETGAIFAGTGSEVAVKPKRKEKEKKESSKRNRFDEMKANGNDTNLELDCDEDEKKNKELQERLEKMREFAKKISQQLEKEKQAKAKENSSSDEKTSVKEEKAEEGEITDSSDTTKKEEKPTQETPDIKHKHKKHGKEKHSKDKHHKDKKSKKHKKRKDAKFEGETISHLAKHSTFKSADTETEEKKKEDDDYVLQSLFKKSGVHSALQHDTIMMSSNPDYALVEGEAERVAKEAAAALKKSRQRCHSARSGIPTWTGQSGKPASATKPRFGQKKNSQIVESKAKEEKPKEKPEPKQPKKESSLFDGTVAGNVKTDATGSASLNVMSSGELMQRMRKRNQHTTPADTGGADDDTAHDVGEETMEFITDIRNFIAFQSETTGQATTKELLDEFSAKIPSSDSAKFKAMLKEICVFYRVDGKGVWRLRPEFR